MISFFYISNYYIVFLGITCFLFLKLSKWPNRNSSYIILAMDSFIFQILPFLILFIFPIFSYANSPISVHFNQSGIKLRNRQWAQVQLQAKGNHPPFQYSYTFYPKTWKFVNQYMYIPIQYFKAYQIYPCRVKITDQSNNHI